MTRGRLALWIALLVALLIGGAAFYVRDRVQSIWSDLRATANLQLPDGYRVVERDERGTAFCVITCSGEGEAQILLTVVGPPGAEPCADLAIGLADPIPTITTEPQPGQRWCLYADLPSIHGGEAFLTVAPEFPSCTPEQIPCVRMVISSGVD